MKAEKIVLAIVGVMGGLLVAGLAFYFFKFSKTPATHNVKNIATPLTPTATPTPETFLMIASPTDESIVSSKTITFSGKSVSGASVIVTTPVGDGVSSVSASGSFSVDVPIDTGGNEITITAIMPSGEEVVKKMTVTYSADSF